MNVIDTKSPDFKFEQQPVEFGKYDSRYHRTRYVADFEATTYFETDDPKLNTIDAKNTIDGKRHVYPKSEHQRVDVWLWVIQEIKYNKDGHVLPTNQHYGTSIESFIDYIKDNCIYADIYFHNGANYDSKFIWDYCLNNDFVSIKQGTSYGGFLNTITGSYSRYTIRFNNGNAINFRDTRDIFKTSIRAMGETLTSVQNEGKSQSEQVDELKGDTPIIVSDDYYKPDFKVKQEWIDYCKRDVQILHDYITFRQTIDTSHESAENSIYMPDGSKVNSITIDFDVPSKVESGYATIAGWAYATMMNDGIEPRTALNPYFVPVANVKIDPIVRPKKGKIIDHWEYQQKHGQINHQEFVSNLSDDKIERLKAQYDAKIVRQDDSNDPVNSEIIQWSTKDTYYVYVAKYRDITDNELVQYKEYQERAKKGNYNQLVSDGIQRDVVNSQEIDWIMFDAKRLQAKAEKRQIGVGTKASHGSIDRVKEIKAMADNTKSDTYKQQLIAKVKQEAEDTLITMSNDMAKRAYKGGVSMVGPYHMNKYEQVSGYELDVNSLYPSIYGNLRWNEATDEQRQQGLAGRNYVFPKNYTTDIVTNPTKAQLRYYMNHIDKKPSFVKLAFVSAKIKDGKMPIIKPRTDDFYNDDQIYVNGDFADPRQHYYPEIVLRNLTLAMPDFKYLCDNYVFDKDTNGSDKLTVSELWIFERDTELEQKMFHHASKWSSIKRFSKGQNHKGVRLYALESYSKLMINSPYGKMGNYKKQYETQMITSKGALNIGSTTGGNNKAEVPAAAYITSYGRTYLAETVNKVGFKHFIYGDTDSIYMVGNIDESPIAKAGLVDKTELGKWAHEKSFNSFKAIKSKCYGIYEVDQQNGKPLAWKTTAAGFTSNIDQDSFNTSASSIVQRSKVVKGGKLIYKTYQQINPISPAYLALLNEHYQLNITN